MNRFFKFSHWALLAMSLVATPLFTACSDDNDPELAPDSTTSVENDFHVAFANGTDNPSGTLLQGLSSLSEGVIRPIGHQMESSRTARIFVSKDRKTVWSLNYTVGSIEKLTYKKGDQYALLKRFDASVPLGSTTVRFTKMNEEVGSVHEIKATAVYGDEKDPSTYQGHQMLASIGFLDLDKMELREGYKKRIEVKLSDELAKQGYYIFRIDAPVFSGDKIYYGAGLRKYNPLTKKNLTVDKTCTLVLDYPSLNNPTVLVTDHVAGSTNGYRTPTQHVNEKGEILQLVSGNKEVHIAKLVNGKYDTSFDVNLSKLLNKGAASNGFFYAGNGIAYVPYEDYTTESHKVGVDPDGKDTFSYDWKLARIDLNKGTAVDLNVPGKLWLTQYQNSVVRDGVFYIALAPVGSEGNIYMFDVNSESAEGKKGAALKGTNAQQYYIGIY